MTAKRTWPIVAWLAMGTIVASRATADQAPNILLIVADDLGWGDAGFNGRGEWTTPHLDRLAARGVVLKRCYAAAPVCGPSRASLLTGKYTIHCGVRRNDQDLPAGEVTIAEALRLRGYRTAVFGKWQGGKPRPGLKSDIHPMDQGFDSFFGYRDPYEALEKFPSQLWLGRSRIPVSGYIDDLITDRALEFVSQGNSSPFFLYMAYLAPHFALDAPADEIARHLGKLPESNPSRAINATYAAMITRLDYNVGRLVELLERLDLARNTLMIFVSDNGGTFEFGNDGASVELDSNRPLRGQKRTLWEGGIRVPAIVSWPARIAAGRVSHEPVHMIDLYPTLVSAAAMNREALRPVDGENLLPFWCGDASLPVRTLFWEWQSEGTDQVAAMRGNHKLIVTRGGKPELYDVTADPSERRDLAAIHPREVKELQGKLTAWLATEDPGCRE